MKSLINLTQHFAIKPICASLMIAAFSSSVMADADISVTTSGSSSATANVDISVVVPQVLVFGVGAFGTDIASLQWTLPDNAGNNPFPGAFPPSTAAAFGDADATVLANGDAGALTASATDNTATLPVYMFSNSGVDVNIAYSAAGTGGASTANALTSATNSSSIPMSDFTLTDAGNIAHPNPSSASTTVTAGGAVISTTDAWTYSFAPSATYLSGTYEGRITYVASTP